MYVILEEIGRRLMFVSGGLINGGGSVGGERKSGAEAPRGLKPALQVRGRTPVLPASHAAAHAEVRPTQNVERTGIRISSSMLRAVSCTSKSLSKFRSCGSWPR